MFIPGFQFNPISAQLCSRYDDGLNLMWNAGMMKLQTNAMLNQFPSANGSIFSPFAWQSSMNYLLDPRYTMMQFNQQYGNWGFGGFGGNGGVNLFNGSFDIGNMWKNVFSNNGGSNGSNGGSAPTVEGKKLNAMKQVFERLKKASEKSPFLSPEILDEYNEALKAEGDLAKVEALEKVFKKIKPAKLRQAILADSSVAELLKQSGYNMSSVKYYKADEKDANWKKIMGCVSSDLNSGTKEDIVRATGIIESNKDEILQAISAWNDSNDTKFLKAIAAKAHYKDSEKEHWEKAVNSFTKALTDMAVEYSDYSSVKTKKIAVEEALKEVNKSFTQANVEALSDKFDALYAELRVIKAQETDKYIKENFGFINDLKEGAAPEGAILKETKEDLKSEGLSAPSTVLAEEDDDEIAENDLDDLYEDDPDGALDALVNGNEGGLTKPVLKESAKKGVYETATTSTNANKKFYTKDGNKIVELKDVKAIDKDGNCTMIDGSKKALADVQKVEVTAQTIQNYQETVKKIDRLISEGKLVKVTTMTSKAKGITVYRSKEKDSSGNNQYFIIRNDELVKVNGQITPNGYLMGSAGKHISNLTDSDVSAFDESALPTKTATTTSSASVGTPATAGTTPAPTKAENKYVGEDPAALGKCLRQKLRGDTSDHYDEVDKIIAVFESMEDAKDIYNFIKGYLDERNSDDGIAWNSKLCAQISSENKYGKAKKAKALQIIAKKVMILMDNCGWSKLDEDYEDMEFAATKTDEKSKSWRRDGNRFAGMNWFGKGWSFFSSSRTGYANHMDDIIEKVMEKYKEAQGESQE